MPSVVANGIEMHYVEAGSGVPLILVDNAMVSSNPDLGRPPVRLSHTPRRVRRALPCGATR